LSKQPLVTVIVPTRNSAKFLDDCLRSVINQTYPNIELIVVDRDSTDETKRIAHRYTELVFNKGPERSAQRNYGVSKAKGMYVLIIDSDMVLSRQVVAQCVKTIETGKNSGIIVPEESYGDGFWAQCKRLERTFYVGLPWMEAARFFTKDTYVKVGGYNETMISGEDWDLSQRVQKIGGVSRISAYVYHNEGRLRLLETLRKKYYYASKLQNYKSSNYDSPQLKMQTSVARRYLLFLSQPKKLFANPAYGAGMLLMKTLEFSMALLSSLSFGKKYP